MIKMREEDNGMGKLVKEKRNFNKGITLIALVITIIVLLILAAVSITTLTGENGILTKAIVAKNETQRMTAKEKVQIAVMGSYGTDGRLDYKQLKANLDKVEGIEEVPDEITDDHFDPQLIVYVDNYKVLIDKDGTVTIEEEKVDKEGLVLYTTFNDKVSFVNENYTVQGDQQIKIDSHSKVGKGSCYFPGTPSQRLNQVVPDLNFAKNDFTIEFWAYAETQVMNYVLLIGVENNNDLQFFLNHPDHGGNLGIFLGSNRIITTTKRYTENEWVHYAIVRKDGIFTLYENGEIIGTSSENFRNSEVNISNLAIGGNQSVTNTAYKGYMDELAIYNYAKYETSFTPAVDTAAEEKVLYSSFDTEIALKKPIIEIKDSITKKAYENLGNTKIYITEEKSKTGGKSVYFAGEARQRLNQIVPDLDFGKEDFTIEFWSYAEPQVMSHVLLVGVETNDNLQFFLNSPDFGGNMGIYLSGNRVITTTKRYTENEWVHYAIVRKGGIFTLYENGTAIGSSPESYKDLEVNISNLAIGGNQSVINTAYKGYMDDLAIYKKAKYTQNFTINP